MVRLSARSSLKPWVGDPPCLAKLRWRKAWETPCLLAYRSLDAQIVSDFKFGDRPNTVSESTVSNTELSEFFVLVEFWGKSSVSSSQPTTCVQSELTEFFVELTEFAQKLSESSLPKQYSRNSILPVSHNPTS